MLDWLVIWGVAQGAAYIFRPVLEDLAKDAAKYWARDLLKGCLKNVVQLPKKEQKKLAGNAVKAFLDVFEEELKALEVEEGELQALVASLKKYSKDKQVMLLLGKALGEDAKDVTGKALAERWAENQLRSLPDDFDWHLISTQYVRRVKSLKRDIEALAKRMDAEHLDAIRDGVDRLAGLSPGFDLAKMKRSILDRYGHLQLERLDALGTGYVAMALLQVFVPQNLRECREYAPQLYNLPKDVQKRLAKDGMMGIELSEPNLERVMEAYKQAPVRNVLEVIDRTATGSWVILGDPGSGKSTLLRYLALCWAERPVKELASHPIPLLIEMRRYNREEKVGRCQNFLEFLFQGDVCCNLETKDVAAYLHSGNALVMFDGLDEIFEDADRERTVHAIVRFANDYPNAKVLVTSRVIGYRHEILHNARFEHHLIQDLDGKQIEAFIERWHQMAYSNDLAEKKRIQDRLGRAIEESSPIRQLAGNPLLLTLMAILNRNQELPRDRVDLYKQASRLLLHQWDVARALKNEKLDPSLVDLRDKQELLRKTAYHMQASEKGIAGNIIHHDDLEALFVEFFRQRGEAKAVSIARVLIENLRARNFILCDMGGSYYGFVHRTFLEFFSAWAFVHRFGKRGTAEGLTVEALIELFCQKYQDESWREVLCLIAGMIEPEFIAPVISALMEIDGEKCDYANLLIAGDCATEVRDRAKLETVIDKLLDQLKPLIKFEKDNSAHFSEFGELEILGFTRTKVVALVSALGKEKIQVKKWLISSVQTAEHSDVRATALRELARGWKDDVETLGIVKSAAQSAEHSGVRATAMQELARGWKDDVETLGIVQSAAQTAKPSGVRATAMQELARVWKEDVETLGIVKSAAQTAEHSNVRRVSIQVLARGWKEEVETLPWLKSAAQTAEHSDVRATALRELARGWKEDVETLGIVKSAAQTAEHSDVRATSLRELARGWKEDVETLGIVKSAAQSAKYSSVRDVALQELARGWKEDVETLGIVKSAAQTAEHSDVRATALRELARGWKDDVETLRIVKSAAQTAEPPYVRNAALEELARGWKDDEETLGIVKSAAQSAEHSGVRYVALNELVRGWKEDGKTLGIVKSVAQSDKNEAVRLAAAFALAGGWKDDSQVQDWLKKLKEKR